jgi:hypothetical protein
MKVRQGKGDPGDTVIPAGLWIADLLLVLSEAAGDEDPRHVIRRLGS